MSVAKTAAQVRPAAVYRLFDEAGNLLYIGSAYNPEARCEAHRSKPWWSQVHRRTDEWCRNRNTAYRVEAEAIAAEQPRFNELNTGHYSPPDTEVQRGRAAASRERGAAQSRAATIGRELAGYLDGLGLDPFQCRHARNLIELAYIEGTGLMPDWVTRQRSAANDLHGQESGSHGA